MKKHFILLLFLMGSGCVTAPSPLMSPGIQEGYRSYVPARTAVLSCRPWPSTSNFASHPQSNSSDADRESFCKVFDAHVLESFKGQSFMRGFTPRAVEKSLTESKKLALLEKFISVWRLDPQKCGNCADVGTFYERVVKNRLEWREWLTDFSASTHYSDAVLLPFVAFAREDKENDRGLLLSKRSIGLVLLLIDTQTGDLIWTTKRQSLLSNQALTKSNAPNFPEFPEWSLVLQELLIDSLWREYPGKVFI